MIHYGAYREQIDFAHGDTGIVSYEFNDVAWRYSNVRVSFGTRTDDYEYCRLQGQFWAFKIYDDCRDYDSESKAPLSES